MRRTTANAEVCRKPQVLLKSDVKGELAQYDEERGARFEVRGSRFELSASTIELPDSTCGVSFMVKLLRAYGGCLGANRR